MKIKWYQFFGIGAYVAGWFARAIVLRPGEIKPIITKEEQAELGRGLLVMLIQMIGKDIELE